jgi:hypothetical protein
MTLARKREISRERRDGPIPAMDERVPGIAGELARRSASCPAWLRRN